MPRAVKLFEDQGFEVIPAPTDYDLTEEDWQSLTHANLLTQIYNLLPSASNLSSTTSSLKEYLGMFVNTLRDRALLPSPVGADGIRPGVFLPSPFRRGACPEHGEGAEVKVYFPHSTNVERAGGEVCDGPIQPVLFIRHLPNDLYQPFPLFPYTSFISISATRVHPCANKNLDKIDRMFYY